MSYRIIAPIKKSIIKSIFILFVAGSLMHFIYDLSGESIIVGLFAPVNESVWEHNKLVLLPLVCWWTIYYMKYHIRNKMNKRKWFNGAVVSLVVAIGIIPILHYFYTGAFGIESLVFDFIIFFLSLLFGQLSGFYIYKYSKGINLLFSILMIISIVVLFVVFTLNPPHLPIFRDGPTGNYGIF